MSVFPLESLITIIDEMAEQAVLVSVPDLRIVHANRNYLASVGLDLEKARGQNCHRVSHGLDQPCEEEGHQCPAKISMVSGTSAKVVHLHQEVGGGQILVNVSSHPIRDEHGKVTMVLEVIRRDDEIRRLHDDLKKKSGFLENILMTCPEGIIGNDRSGTVFLFNEGAERIFGYKCKEVLGKIHAKNLYPEGLARDVMDQTLSENFGGYGRLLGYETFIRDKYGRDVPIRISATLLYEDGEESGVIGFFRDITELRRMEEELRTLSITDGMTQLYNRRHFETISQKEVDRVYRSGARSTLLILDVDHFKQYNDTYGHTEGDVVLKTLGELINKSFRAGDTGFRFGGEEFAVILPDTSAETALMPAERLRTQVEAFPFMPAGAKEPVSVTISIGIAEFTAGRVLDEVIRLADAAMYEAKKVGRNHTVISKE